MPVEHLLDPLTVFSQSLGVAENEFLYLSSPVEFHFLKIEEDASVHFMHSFLVLPHQSFELNYLRVKGLKLRVVSSLFI